MKRKTVADVSHEKYLTRLQELTIPHVLRRLKTQPSMKSRDINALLGFHLNGSEIEPLFRRLTVFERAGKVWHLLPQVKALGMEHMTDAELVRYLKEEDWESGPVRKKQKYLQPARVLSAEAGPSTTANIMKLMVSEKPSDGPTANLKTVSLTELARTFALNPESARPSVPKFTLAAETRIKQEEKENTDPTSADSAPAQVSQHAATSVPNITTFVQPKASVISTSCRPWNVWQAKPAETTTSSKSVNAFTFAASKSYSGYRTIFGPQRLNPCAGRSSTAFPQLQGSTGGGLLQASIGAGAYSFGPTSTTFASGQPFISKAAKNMDGRSVPSPFQNLAPSSSTWTAPWKTPSKMVIETTKQAAASGRLNPWKKTSSTPVVSDRTSSTLEPFGWQIPKNNASDTTAPIGSTSLPVAAAKPVINNVCDVAVQTEASGSLRTSRRSVSSISASSASMSISSSSTSASSSTSVEVPGAESSNVNNDSAVRLPSIHTLLRYGEHEACISMGIIDVNTGAVHTFEQQSTRVNLGGDHLLKPVVMTARMSDGTKCWATIRIRRAEL